MKCRKHAAIAVMVLLLLAALAWAWSGYRAQRQLARVKELGQQLRAQGLTAQQRKAQFAEVRKEVAKLSPRQRQELSAERRKASTDRLRQFFKMTRREQQAKLDQDIRRMEQRRREFEKSAAGQAKGGNGPWGGPFNGGRGAGDRDARARHWLDQTTPEERALHSAYRQAVDDRRRQLGLPPARFGRPH